ncbi:MAG: hypothetical protein RIQ93_271 [Verrucomicrobiota bacterium]
MSAAHWPGFRGPHGDGVAEGVHAPVEFGATRNVVWTADLPPGLSGPAIWADHIFLTGADEKNVITLCLDRATGKTRWEQKVAVAKMESVHRVNSRATPTAVTNGKAVFVYFGSLGVLAYDFAGRELWRKPLPVPKTFQNQGTGTSPVLIDNKLIVFLQLGNDSRLLALDPANGAELWAAPMPVHNNTYSTPVTWQENGQSFVGLACAARFTAFRVGDGQESWWINEIGYQACSTPVVLGDRILIAAAGVQGEAANITPPPTFDEAAQKFGRDGEGLIAYDTIPNDLLFTDRHTSGGQGNMTLKGALRYFGKVKAGDKLDRSQWEKARERLTQFGTGHMNRTVVLCARTGGQDDVTASSIIWKETKGVPEVPSPLVWQGRAYFIRSGGVLVCRDIETGRLVYEERIGSPGGYYASPVVAGGRLYLISDQGTVTVVKCGDTLEVLARNRLGEAVTASPAILDNTLYVRSARRLWAFAAPQN